MRAGCQDQDGRVASKSGGVSASGSDPSAPTTKSRRRSPPRPAANTIDPPSGEKEGHAPEARSPRIGSRESASTAVDFFPTPALPAPAAAVRRTPPPARPAPATPPVGLRLSALDPPAGSLRSTVTQGMPPDQGDECARRVSESDN